MYILIVILMQNERSDALHRHNTRCLSKVLTYDHTSRWLRIVNISMMCVCEFEVCMLNLHVCRPRRQVGADQPEITNMLFFSIVRHVIQLAFNHGTFVFGGDFDRDYAVFGAVALVLNLVVPLHAGGMYSEQGADGAHADHHSQLARQLRGRDRHGPRRRLRVLLEPRLRLDRRVPRAWRCCH